MEILRKTKISWAIYENSIIVFDKMQATCYLDINAKSRKSFDEFKEILLNSSPDEYGNWVDAICLAQKKGMMGYGTVHRPEWD